MATKMLMPLLGQTMEEGTIIKWFKQEGDDVTEGEPLLEVMTDKVNMEVEAPASGLLLKILAKVDDVVPVQAPIALIGEPGEALEDEFVSPEEAEAASAQEIPAHEVPMPELQYPPLAGEMPVATPMEENRIFASPAARRLAREHDVDIEELAGRGSGPDGRIVEKDVLAFVSSRKATPLAEKIAADRGVDLGEVTGSGIGGKITKEDVEGAAMLFRSMPIGGSVPFTGVRKAVADAVSGSWRSAVHVTLVTEVDMTQCVALRRQVMDEIEKSHGVKISFTDIIVKAVGRAIFSKPIVNSSIEDGKIVIHDQVNIGVATAVEDGLVVPVVKDVPGKSLHAVSAEIKRLAERSRAGTATGEDYQGGTFSVTNLGNYGIDMFSPIIIPGQSAILGICRIVDKPVAIDGCVEIRSMMNLCLSFDHRVMDGVPAAEFLNILKSVLEAPSVILL